MPHDDTSAMVLKVPTPTALPLKDNVLPGRPPTPLDQDLVDAIVANVAAGLVFGQACKLAGIVNPATHATWWRTGSGVEPAGKLTTDDQLALRHELVARCEAAEASFEADLIGGILQHPDWRGRAFILERRYRDRWGIQDQVASAAAQTVVDILRAGMQPANEANEATEAVAAEALPDRAPQALPPPATAGDGPEMPTPMKAAAERKRAKRPGAVDDPLRGDLNGPGIGEGAAAGAIADVATHQKDALGRRKRGGGTRRRGGAADVLAKRGATNGERQ